MTVIAGTATGIVETGIEIEIVTGSGPATVTGIGKEIGLTETAIAIATEIEPTETVTGMISVGFRACPAGRILIRIMIAFLIAASC